MNGVGLGAFYAPPSRSAYPKLSVAVGSPVEHASTASSPRKGLVQPSVRSNHAPQITACLHDLLVTRPGQWVNLLAEMETFYDILEVAAGASQETIAAAYRSLCKRCHPDTNEGSQEATQRLKKINEAYETLGDASKRRRYDETLHSSRTDESTQSPPLSKSQYISGTVNLSRSIAIRLVLCGVACLLNGVGLAIANGAEYWRKGLFAGVVIGLVWSSLVLFAPEWIRYAWRFGLARLAEVFKAVRGED